MPHANYVQPNTTSCTTLTAPPPDARSARLEVVTVAYVKCRLARFTDRHVNKPPQKKGHADAPFATVFRRPVYEQRQELTTSQPLPDL
jgi:hypothetical protein